MFSLRKGRYAVRMAETPEDIAAAQRLRYLAFIDGTGAAPRPDGADCDRFDALCRHVLIEERRGGTLVACFRLLPLADGREIAGSYAAQFYDLSRLSGFDGPMVELGRFCIRPGHRDPDILRIAWGALARYVDEAGVELLFGCSSFHGTDARAYTDAFAVLEARHLAPKRWLPKVKAPDVFRFARRAEAPDAKRAFLTMPPLLRSYLAMGGWVSDHAVVDRDMNTLHVFTGLEVRAIPPARARALRHVAA